MKETAEQSKLTFRDKEEETAIKTTGEIEVQAEVDQESIRETKSEGC